MKKKGGDYTKLYNRAEGELSEIDKKLDEYNITITDLGEAGESKVALRRQFGIDELEGKYNDAKVNLRKKVSEIKKGKKTAEQEIETLHQTREISAGNQTNDPNKTKSAAAVHREKITLTQAQIRHAEKKKKIRKKKDKNRKEKEKAEHRANEIRIELIFTSSDGNQLTEDLRKQKHDEIVRLLRKLQKTPQLENSNKVEGDAAEIKIATGIREQILSTDKSRAELEEGGNQINLDKVKTHHFLQAYIELDKEQKCIDLDKEQMKSDTDAAKIITLETYIRRINELNSFRQPSKHTEKEEEEGYEPVKSAEKEIEEEYVRYLQILIQNNTSPPEQIIKIIIEHETLLAESKYALILRMLNHYGDDERIQILNTPLNKQEDLGGDDKDKKADDEKIEEDTPALWKTYYQLVSADKDGDEDEENSEEIELTAKYLLDITISMLWHDEAQKSLPLLYLLLTKGANSFGIKMRNQGPTERLLEFIVKLLLTAPIDIREQLSNVTINSMNLLQVSIIINNSELYHLMLKSGVDTQIVFPKDALTSNKDSMYFVPEETTPLVMLSNRNFLWCLKSWPKVTSEIDERQIEFIKELLTHELSKQYTSVGHVKAIDFHSTAIMQAISQNNFDLFFLLLTQSSNIDYVMNTGVKLGTKEIHDAVNDFHNDIGSQIFKSEADNEGWRYINRLTTQLLDKLSPNCPETLTTTLAYMIIASCVPIMQVDDVISEIGFRFTETHNKISEWVGKLKEKPTPVEKGDYGNRINEIIRILNGFLTFQNEKNSLGRCDSDSKLSLGYPRQLIELLEYAIMNSRYDLIYYVAWLKSENLKIHLSTSKEDNHYYSLASEYFKIPTEDERLTHLERLNLVTYCINVPDLDPLEKIILMMVINIIDAANMMEDSDDDNIDAASMMEDSADDDDDDDYAFELTSQKDSNGLYALEHAILFELYKKKTSNSEPNSLLLIIFLSYCHQLTNQNEDHYKKLHEFINKHSEITDNKVLSEKISTVVKALRFSD